jgi:plastocyanin
LVLSGLAFCFFACTSTANSTHANSDASGLTITIRNFAFDPLNIYVPAGDTVTVVNDDVEPHTVTSESKLGDYTMGAVNGVQFDTGSIGVNASRTFTVAAAAISGTLVPYYCAIHNSGMGQGTVIVQ